MRQPTIEAVTIDEVRDRGEGRHQHHRAPAGARAVWPMTPTDLPERLTKDASGWHWPTCPGEQHHRLKTWPGPFGAILDGRKAFELREDDRGFRVGDVLFLQEWAEGAAPYPRYTGAVIRTRVTSMVSWEDVGLPWHEGLLEGWCVMGIHVEGVYIPEGP